MKHYTLRYPGDDPVPAVEMNRKEFLEAYPRDPIKLLDDEGVVETIEIPEGTILCDMCNADPGDWILVVDDSRAYCKACAEPLTKHLNPVQGNL